MAGYEGDTYNQVVEAEGGMFGGADADAKAADVSSRHAQAKGEKLAEGQAFREGLNPSDQDYLGHPHEDLYAMAHTGNDPTAVNEQGRIYADLAELLRGVGQDAAGAANAEETSWQGGAAEQAHGFVRTTGDWLHGTAQGSELASNRYAQQSVAAQNAQNAMPEPVPFDQAAEMEAARTQLNSGDISGVTQGMQSMDAMAGKQQASQDAHAQAAQVMHDMDGTLYDTGSTQPAFAAPPTLDGGQPGQPSTGHTQAASATSAPPALGGTAGTAGSAGGVAGPAPGGGSAATPGSPTGAGPVSGSGPAQPGGGAPGGQPSPGSTQGAGRGAVGAPLAAAAGGNVAGAGAQTSRRSARPGLGSTAGGRVSGGSSGRSGTSGSEPRGSAASRLGDSKTGGGKQGGAAGRAGNELGSGKGTGSAPTEKAPKEGIARGGQAASGGKGTGPAGAGMPGGGRGGKDEDKERQRPSYLKEDDPETIFESKPDEGPDGERPVPPTIGT